MPDASFLLPLIGIAFLILLSAFFSGSETGLTSVSRSKIHRLKMTGNRKAIAVSKLHERKEQFISSILLGNNVVNIAASAMATALAISWIGPSGVLYATIVMTILVLVLAEVLPKTYAVRHAEQVALAVVPAITLLTNALSPFTVSIQAFVNRVISLISSPPAKGMSGVDALRGAVDMYHAEGDVQTDDKDMLSGIFNLGDTTIQKVMLHRSDIVATRIDAPIADIIAFAARCTHSRIPIWENDPSNIIGILHVKDLFKALQNAPEPLSAAAIRALLRAPWFVPESITLKNQLQAFREQRKHLALVVDECGSLSGLVTLEDIIEEVVGEIEDEHDKVVASPIEAMPDGSYQVEGDLSLRELNHDLGWTLADAESTTLAGYLMTHAQRIPEVGEIFEIGDFMLEVLAREKTRITRIQILKTDALPNKKEDA